MTKWISVTEAARLSNYHPEHIRELIREHKIKARKIVTVWQVDLTSLEDYLRRLEKRGEKRGPKKRS